MQESIIIGNKMQIITRKNNLDDNVYYALQSLKTNVLFSEEIKKSEKNKEMYTLFKKTISSNDVKEPIEYYKKLDKAAKLMVSMQEEAWENNNAKFAEIIGRWAIEARKNFPD
jgi:predicted CopG family antitoxin